MRKVRINFGLHDRRVQSLISEIRWAMAEIPESKRRNRLN